MNTFAKALAQHTELSVEDQIKAGQPLGDDMPQAHIEYLKVVVAALDAKTFSYDEPRSLVHADLYEKAPAEIQGKIDLMLPTIADSLRHIVVFYRDPKTPNACPQLKTMIDHLAEMFRRLGPAASIFTLPSPPSA